MNTNKINYEKEVSGLDEKEKKYLLTGEHIAIGFQQDGIMNKVVDDVSFQLREGEILGIVGESGSGKTMTALAIAGLLKEDATILGGSILFEDKDLLKLKTDFNDFSRTNDFLKPSYDSWISGGRDANSSRN